MYFVFVIILVQPSSPFEQQTGPALFDGIGWRFDAALQVKRTLFPTQNLVDHLLSSLLPEAGMHDVPIFEIKHCLLAGMLDPQLRRLAFLAVVLDQVGD